MWHKGYERGRQECSAAPLVALAKLLWRELKPCRRARLASLSHSLGESADNLLDVLGGITNGELGW